MLTITQEVQALVRDRHETLRLSAQTASDCQALCTKLRAELVRLRQTIEAGHECEWATQTEESEDPGRVVTPRVSENLMKSQCT